MPIQRLTFQVDFSELAGRTNRLIWRVTQLASFALTAADNVRDDDFTRLTMPGARIDIGPEHVPGPQTRIAFRQWIIGCALRDSVESFLMLLDGVRRICAIARLANRGEVPAEEFAAEEKLQADFHLLTLSQKLRCLTREFGIKLPRQKKSPLFKLVAARNCLVHRLGTVAEVDRNSEGGLTVSWLGLEMRALGEAGTRVIDAFPADFAAGETLQVVARERSRTLAIGEQIDFSTADFTEVGLFLQGLSQQVAQLTETAAGLPATTPTPPSAG